MQNLLSQIHQWIAGLSGAVSSDGNIKAERVDPKGAPIDFYFTRVAIPPTTLAADAPAVDPNTLTYDVDVTDSTGCIVGDYFGIFNADEADNNRAYFGNILAISVGGGAGGSDRITLDTPLDYAFLTGDTAACLNRELAQNGSATPQIYSIQVGENATQSIKITRFMVSMYTAGAPTLAEFGDLPVLTNGLVLRQVDGTVNNIWNVKDNGELAHITFDFDIYTAIGQGQAGAKWRNTYGGEDKHDAPIILNPGDELQLIIQDDLTGLDQFRVIAEGRYIIPT